MSTTVDLAALQQKKKILEEKRASLKGEEKYLEGEKARLKARLQELGFNSLADAKAALGAMEESFEAKSKELDALLEVLENSSAETHHVVQEQPVLANLTVSSIDDL